MKARASRTPNPEKNLCLVWDAECRDEMNVAEFPVALLSDRAPRGTDTIEFRDSIRNPATGEMVPRKVTIRGAGGLGLPTAKDDEVILALITLTKEKNNFAERRVYFSRYELIQLLRWPYSGQSFRRLGESLSRWLGVALHYEKAWWDNRVKSWVDRQFHFIDNLDLYERERPTNQVVMPFSSFTWNEVVFQSFQDGYLKRLDLNFFLGLETSTARRIYRFLDKHFYHRHRLEYDLKDFAFEHVGLSRDYDSAQTKRKLAPAIEELEAKGFLAPLKQEERYLRVRRGEWRALFLRSRGKNPEPEAPKSVSQTQQDLTDRGVTASVAAELVATHSPERISVKIEVFDWLLEHKDKRVSKNPAGYLVKSIQEDYQAPQGFEPKAEREKKKQAAEERKRKRQEAQERKDQQEEARRLAERAPLDAYWNSLNPREQRALEEEAMQKASPQELAEYRRLREGGPLAEAKKRLLVEKHIRNILGLAQDDQQSGPQP